MVNKTKKVKAAGRFGARYGKKVREKLAAVESKQRIRQNCPFCKRAGVKKVSKGIWHCPKCNKKFAGNVFYLE